MRRIIRTKSFVNQLKNWEEYKITSIEDLEHYIKKLRAITEYIIEISEFKNYTSKKVNYRNSKNINYFIYEKHVVFFKLDNAKLTLLYFVAAKHIKKKL